MELKQTQLKGLINKVIYNKLQDGKYLIKRENPIKFLTAKRFDLIAKLIYIKYKESNIQSNFAKELYLKYIEVFNGFYEADGSNKKEDTDYDITRLVK